MIYAAEIGLNHNGNFDLALELIRKAKESGATIAKFQFGWRDKPDEINCIDFNTAKKLKEFSEYVEIEFMASIITEEAFDLALKLGVNRYKIASRTVVENPKLCEKIIQEDKEVFCSLGFWEKETFPFGAPNDKLRYIYCVSEYPALPKDMTHFPSEFNNDGYYGYSDHFLGSSACLLAISRGAKFIEKHFTLNKTSEIIRDHTLSATPDEFADIVKQGNELSRLNQFIKKK